MIFNLFSDDWDEHRSRPGYRWSRTGVGRRLGSELLGASLYQLPPGQATWPYHAHYGNEELLVVLEGRPTLRTPDGERALGAGDTAIFRRGPAGAHQLLNRSDQAARVMMVSTMIHPEIAHYPDTDEIGVFGGAPAVPGQSAPTELLFRTDDATGYWEPEDPGRLTTIRGIVPDSRIRQQSDNAEAPRADARKGRATGVWAGPGPVLASPGRSGSAQ